MENDLIRRSDVKEKLIECIKKASPPLMFPDWNDAVLAVMTVPAVDAVEVVRCRECKMHENCSTEDVFNFAGLNDNRRFCGVGQRREDGDNGAQS